MGDIDHIAYIHTWRFNPAASTRYHEAIFAWLMTHSTAASMYSTLSARLAVLQPRLLQLEIDIGVLEFRVNRANSNLTYVREQIAELAGSPGGGK